MKSEEHGIASPLSLCQFWCNDRGSPEANLNGYSLAWIGSEIIWKLLQDLHWRRSQYQSLWSRGLVRNLLICLWRMNHLHHSIWNASVIQERHSRTTGSAELVYRSKMASIPSRFWDVTTVKQVYSQFSSNLYGYQSKNIQRLPVNLQWGTVRQKSETQINSTIPNTRGKPNWLSRRQ